MKKDIFRSVSIMNAGRIERVVLLGIIFVMLFFAREISLEAKNALSDAFLRVVPSLFPFSVLSSLLLSSKRAVSPRVAILMGLICGFPIGAMCVSSLAERGEITKSQAAHVSAASVIPSPPFLISAVGGIWDFSVYGAFLLVCSILINLTYVTIFIRPLPRHSSSVMSPTSVPSSPTARITSAITAAGTSAVSVVAFITFFRCLTHLLSRLFPPLSPFISAVLEISGGVIDSASTGGMIGCALCGFAVGFSGLSALFQVNSILQKNSVSIKPTVLLSLCRGTVLSLASIVFYSTYGARHGMIGASASVFRTLFWHTDTPYIVASAVFFIIIFTILRPRS